MATGLKTERKPKAHPLGLDAGQVLYLYGVSQRPKDAVPEVAAEGIDGAAAMEAVAYQGYLCWVSRVSRAEFADRLREQMENLEWLASAGLRHQRAVSAIAERFTILPARFGTVFLSEGSLAQHLRDHKKNMPRVFKRLAGADEWGIKVFETAKPEIMAASEVPASGREYLKRKAESLQPKRGVGHGDEMRGLIRELSSLSEDSSPGGKASLRQPGLLWHGSFLVKRKDRKKLQTVLEKYAAKWQDKWRIDCSGPWPPYSFVAPSPGRGRRSHGQ